MYLPGVGWQKIDPPNVGKQHSNPVAVGLHWSPFWHGWLSQGLPPENEQ